MSDLGTPPLQKFSWQEEDVVMEVDAMGLVVVVSSGATAQTQLRRLSQDKGEPSRQIRGPVHRVLRIRGSFSNLEVILTWVCII